MKTRNGTKFRLYADDGYGPYSLHGAVLTPDGWIIFEWTAQGFVKQDGTPDELDICHVVATWQSGNLYTGGFNAQGVN